MQFIPLSLQGAFLIEMERRCDDRGYFARTFCLNEFKAQNLSHCFVQCSTSFNLKKGLIRGMHFQAAPFQETKLVRCTKGAIFDVLLDLRKDSPSFNQWYGVELSQANGKSLYIPKGIAHGYQVLENDSEVFYMMDEFYVPGSAQEVSAFNYGIKWPLVSLDNYA